MNPLWKPKCPIVDETVCPRSLRADDISPYDAWVPDLCTNWGDPIVIVEERPSVIVGPTIFMILDWIKTVGQLSLQFIIDQIWLYAEWMNCFENYCSI